MAVPKRNPSRVNKTVNPAVRRLSNKIFWLCHKTRLNLGDEDRREIAGQFRKDKVCSMQGMKPEDLYQMVVFLNRRLTAQQNEAAKENREIRLKQKKRVDGSKSPWASERARHFLRKEAEVYWGDQWEIKLNGFLGQHAVFVAEQKQTPLPGCVMIANGLHFISWNHPEIPKGLHYNATQGMLAMSGRAVKKRGKG
jgi:hypothetical protein